MASIAEIRQKYPQYKDMSDQQLADALHAAHYSDIPKDVFNQKIGLTLSEPQPQDTAVTVAPQNRTNIVEQGLHYATGGLSDKVVALSQTLGDPSRPGGVETGSFGDRYRKNLQNTRAGYGEYAAENPGMNKGAKVAGVVAPMLLPMGGGGFLPQLGKGAAIGAGYGYGSTDDSSVLGNVIPTLGGAVLGAGATGIGYGAGSLIGSAAGKFSTRNMQAKPDAKAAARLLKAMEEQGVNEQGLATFLMQQRGNKPMTVMDMGDNTPMARLGRGLVTLPGKPSEEITTFLNNRQAAQRGRVLSDIEQVAPNTDTYGAQAALNSERSVNSDPLYQQAFAHAGVGPIDFEASRSALLSATSAKAQIAKQIKAIEKNNPGALTSRGAAGKDVRDNYMALHQQLQEAEFARRAAASEFENAQAGISAIEGNQPLTDERLAAFMKDRDIRAGMERGLDIQRRKALANDEEFDPAAYAITGYNEKGMPQVGPVPTWRTLHAGREGLDQIINEFKDQFGNLPKNKLTDSYVELRRAYDATLKRLNPHFSAADAAWAGPSQKKDAIRLGENFTKADPEQIAINRARMNAETDPYYQMGAGRNMREVANDTKDNRNISTKLAGDQTARDQLVAAFGPEKAAQLIQSLEAETAMTGTKNFVTSGSQTANKFMDLLDEGWKKRALNGAIAGGTPGAMTLNLPLLGGGAAAGAVANVARPAISNWVDRKFADEARNLVLAKILTTPGERGATEIAGLLGPAKKAREVVAAKSRKGRDIGAAVGRGILALPLLAAPSR